MFLWELEMRFLVYLFIVMLLFLSPVSLSKGLLDDVKNLQESVTGLSNNLYIGKTEVGKGFKKFPEGNGKQLGWYIDILYPEVVSNKIQVNKVFPATLVSINETVGWVGVIQEGVMHSVDGGDKYFRVYFRLSSDSLSEFEKMLDDKSYENKMRNIPVDNKWYVSYLIFNS